MVWYKKEHNPKKASEAKDNVRLQDLYSQKKIQVEAHIFILFALVPSPSSISGV